MTRTMTVPDILREEDLFSHRYAWQGDHGVVAAHAGHAALRENLFSEPVDEDSPERRAVPRGRRSAQPPRNPFQYTED